MAADGNSIIHYRGERYLAAHGETLLDAWLRQGAPVAHLIRRWSALHERFRAEIVKPVARGRVVDGEPMPHIDSVCDGCGEEILAGRPVRYRFRLGTLHCERCAGLAA